MGAFRSSAQHPGHGPTSHFPCSPGQGCCPVFCDPFRSHAHVLLTPRCVLPVQTSEARPRQRRLPPTHPSVPAQHPPSACPPRPHWPFPQACYSRTLLPGTKVYVSYWWLQNKLLPLPPASEAANNKHLSLWVRNQSPTELGALAEGASRATLWDPHLSSLLWLLAALGPCHGASL